MGSAMRRMSVSPAMGVALLALVLATTTGTALAATGTLVNITDGTNAANVAKVDANGALKTATTSTVPVRDGPPAKPFSTAGAVSNFYKNGSTYQVITGATSATVAVTQLLFTNGITNANDWEIYVYYETVPAGGTCKAFSAGHKLVALVNVQQRDTLVDPLPSPVVLKPSASAPQWCLMSGGGPTHASASTGDGGVVTVGVNGYVVSGTFAPATASAPASKGPQRDRLGG
jgi:hypothetical protein